jgi:hypothetical protein
MSGRKPGSAAMFDVVRGSSARVKKGIGASVVHGSEKAWHQDAPVVAEAHLGVDTDIGQIVAAALTNKGVDDAA